jgi:hypothetical protein
MHRRLSIWALLVPALLAIGLAGCGGSSSGNGVASKSASEIFAASQAAAASASSVHVAGALSSNGTPLTLNLDLSSGHGGRGRVSQGSLAFELLVVDDTVYIKGSPSFYSHFGGSAAAQLFQGKWLQAPASGSELASLASLTDFGKLINQSLDKHGALIKGPVTTVDGQSVIELRDATNNGSLYVATSGHPYPVQVVKRGSEPGRITFSRWNEPVSLSAPSSAIDLSQLEHSGG